MQHERFLRFAGAAAMAAMTTTEVGCAAVAPSTEAPTAPLAGTRWHLVAIQSMDDAQGTVRPPEPARYTLAFQADGRVEIRLDCNRGTATWRVQPAAQGGPHRASGQLLLGPLATTRAACAPDSLASRLVSSWPYVRSYLIEGGRLHLSLMADGGVLTWVPAP
jgi:heat shock protein HslJ